MQNLFLIHNSSPGTDTAPVLVMRVPSSGKTSCSSCDTINVTTFTMNSNDPGHLYWSEPPNRLTLESKLSCSDQLVEIMRLN